MASEARYITTAPAPVPTILEEAQSLVYGAREDDYGNPRDNMRAVGALWESYLSAKGLTNIEFTAGDVAVMLLLLKLGRYATGRGKRDTYVDIAGYAAVLARTDGIDE